MYNRKDFNSLYDHIDGLEGLIDRDGKINKNDPKYRQAMDIIFFNLLDDIAQEAISGYVQEKHENMEDVGMSYKDMFDTAQEFFKVDPENDFFKGLLDDNEIEKFQAMKEHPNFKHWNAKTFYELNSELKDRKDNPKRALLAQLFREMMSKQTIATGYQKQKKLKYR